MSSYSGAADRPDRAKAIVAVAAVHAGLAAIILTGLNVDNVKTAFDRMTTINLAEPPPPPPRKPPPRPRQQAMKKPAGAEAPRAEPTPVVAPPTPLPVKSPIAAAKLAGTGNAPSSGAGVSGNGTGAGGAGNGPGGGGDYSGFTPARRITRIPNSEYRMLAATGISSGSVGVTVRVNPDGSPSNCRVARSSGDRGVDGLMCQLTLRYVRFDPARDPSGRPVAEDITFYPNWYQR